MQTKLLIMAFILTALIINSPCVVGLTIFEMDSNGSFTLNPAFEVGLIKLENELKKASALWKTKHIGDYILVAHIGSFSDLSGTNHITVKDGKIVKIVSATHRTVKSGFVRENPTEYQFLAVSSFFEYIKKNINEIRKFTHKWLLASKNQKNKMAGGALFPRIIEAEYDKNYGYPVKYKEVYYAEDADFSFELKEFILKGEKLKKSEKAIIK